MLIRHNFNFKLNPIIKLLIASDLIAQGSLGLLAPIFAIFIDKSITDTDPVIAAGMASAIYLFTRSAFQIPIARLLDSIKGERDDFSAMFWGMICSSLLPIAYLYIDSSLELYFIQFLLGLCVAFTYPSFMSIFTKHIDKGEEGTEWGIYYTFTDISTAATSAIGGVFAATYGFNLVIIVTVIFSVIGTLILWPIKNYLR